MFYDFFPGPCPLKMTGRAAPTLILSDFFLPGAAFLSDMMEISKHDGICPGGNVILGCYIPSKKPTIFNFKCQLINALHAIHNLSQTSPVSVLIFRGAQHSKES